MRWALASLTLVLLSAIAQAQTPPVPTPDAAPPHVDHTLLDEPPPSAYDRARAGDGKMPEPPETMTGQLFKTIFALALVVGVIYLFFRFGPTRNWLAAQGGRGGKIVRVLERIAVDQKSSLLVIEVGNDRLLLGAGEGGMSVLAQLDPNGGVANTPSKRSFRALFDATRPEPPSEVDDVPK